MTGLPRPGTNMDIDQASERRGPSKDQRPLEGPTGLCFLRVSGRLGGRWAAGVGLALLTCPGHGRQCPGSLLRCVEKSHTAGSRGRPQRTAPGQGSGPAVY
jgi:hypothetical protein